MAENKVNLSTEGFSVENAKKESGEVKISGFALPFDTTSRNGFSYRKESIIKNHKTGKNAVKSRSEPRGYSSYNV